MTPRDDASPPDATLPLPSPLAPWLSIIGLGEDGIDGLSPTARHLISDADIVFGGERHLKLAQPLIKGKSHPWPRPIEDAYPVIVKYRGRPVVVLASGDPFNFGIGKQLAAIVPTAEMICLPQPSAFSLAAGRMGWALQDVTTVSLHGRALEGIIRHLHNGARILALSWDGTTPEKLSLLLRARGMEASRVTVLERMGGAHERMTTASAMQGFAAHSFDGLNTIALEVAGNGAAPWPTLAAGRDDALFENDGQLTKREVRAVTLSSLAPREGELLWDIGVGAGSIAIEWLLTGRNMRAIGIETDDARALTAARNAAAFGVLELQIINGSAPAALTGLEAPDAVFIGGGLGDGVLDPAWQALKPGGRMVVNAVTLEGETALFAALQRHGGELTRIDVSRASKLGNLTAWRTAIPVTQWRAVKPC
ncbi:precorrin-6y C5,15-methyltransferase (decarboxylating) subunit CbiE [Hyphomicrobium sp. D-2]|uniref:precorrin-6y C5,15-methyltransferase (decarboxylating) subunit CbiE n=1 Tax=Hyphomicrobium sp. D-2 TaxID=3041621 RepID=UPI002454B712|nr:precorrin-6y C5,15-methyltransferase (decarboxylating) subunit CbiE [Hyphomicrobium sp. D-2]MDH4981151.1 precorrin-6y C5,15-methyltransferase (decarboxylating) subunit CbiE [Hyphomicrobium sp. D-2]